MIAKKMMPNFNMLSVLMYNWTFSKADFIGVIAFNWNVAKF